MKPSPISWTLATLTPSRAIRPLRCLSALLKQQTSNRGHHCGEQRRVPGSVGEATDTAWISIAELPNADLLIVQQGMGPSTQETYGSYDYKLSIHIARPDRVQFVAMLLSITFENEATLFDLEDLKLRYFEWNVTFIEAERAIGLDF